MVLNDCRKKHTNLGMAWIDYKKAYDMISHFWILETLELVQVSENTCCAVYQEIGRNLG